MRTVHMNADEIWHAIHMLQQEHDRLVETLEQLDTRIKSSVGTQWQGPSAEEFRAEYEALSQRVRKAIEELEGLAETLRLEVNQWLEMDKGLS